MNCFHCGLNTFDVYYDDMFYNKCSSVAGGTDYSVNLFDCPQTKIKLDANNNICFYEIDLWSDSIIKKLKELQHHPTDDPELNFTYDDEYEHILSYPDLKFIGNKEANKTIIVHDKFMMMNIDIFVPIDNLSLDQIKANMFKLNKLKKFS